MSTLALADPDIPVSTLESHGREPATEPAARSPRVVTLLITSGFVLGADGILVTYHIAARTRSTDYFALFWASVICALLPMVYHGLQRAISGRRRMVLLGGIGFFTFLPKMFLDPNGPRYFDEYGHYRNALEIIRTGSLFPSDSYLPIEKYFPGLGVATDLVHFVTQLSVWHSGLVVVGLSHCASLLVVYGLAKTLDLSDRQSFVAAIVFGLNPSFMYFDTEFSYESLGLTLAFLAILCTARARRNPNLGWVIGGVLAAVGCAVTHHIASVVMAAACVLVAALHPPDETDLLSIWMEDPFLEELAEERARRKAILYGWVVAAVAVAAPTIWLSTVATPTYAYIAPHIRSAVAELPSALGLTHPHRTSTSTAPSHTQHQLFSGSTVPGYEKLCAYAAPVIVLLLIALVGWRYLRRPRSVPPFRLLILPLALAVLYLASLPFTLTASGGESAHRSWEYSYLGVGIVAGVAFGVCETWLRGRNWKWTRLGVALLASVLAVMLIGNVASGEDVQYRFPGPYTFGSDTWSDSSSLNAVITWLNAHVPVGAHVLCDRTTAEYVEAFTKLDVPKPSDWNSYQIYQYGDHPSSGLIYALRDGGFSYFILNTTIETQYPAESFFEGWTPDMVYPRVMAHMHDTQFDTIVYRKGPYIVFRLHPFKVNP